MNFMLQISSKCGQGGGVQKIHKFCGCLKWMLPHDAFAPAQSIISFPGTDHDREEALVVMDVSIFLR